MFRLNREGIFLDYFPAKDRKNERSPLEFIGKNINEVFSKHLSDRTMYYLEQTLEMKAPHIQVFMNPIVNAIDAL